MCGPEAAPCPRPGGNKEATKTCRQSQRQPLLLVCEISAGPGVAPTRRQGLGAWAVGRLSPRRPGSGPGFPTESPGRRESYPGARDPSRACCPREGRSGPAPCLVRLGPWPAGPASSREAGLEAGTEASGGRPGRPTGPAPGGPGRGSRRLHRVRRPRGIEAGGWA